MKPDEKQKAYMMNLDNKMLLAKDESGNSMPEILIQSFDLTKDGERYFEELNKKMTSLLHKANDNETLRHWLLSIMDFLSEQNFILENGYSNRWRYKEGTL